MEHLITDLYQIMEEHNEGQLIHSSEYKDCANLYDHKLDEIQEASGEDFREKLNDVIFEFTSVQAEAAFT